jgi:hypothetical protein
VGSIVGMDAAALTEAEARYVDRVVEDCFELLGPGVELDGVEIDREIDVVLRLRYRLGTVAWSSEGHGSTVTEAHADLRQRLVLDRVRMATVAIYRVSR